MGPVLGEFVVPGAGLAVLDLDAAILDVALLDELRDGGVSYSGAPGVRSALAASPAAGGGV